MALSMDHAKTVCQLGQGVKTCRYLGQTNGEWICLKLTDARRRIDERVELQTMKARGDNCDGVQS